MATLAIDWAQWFTGQTFQGPRGLDAYGDYQSYAIPTLNLVMAHAAHYGSVLQAGGHIGLVPLALGSRFTRIFTFEAAADNCAWLRENVAGQSRIQAVYGALGDGRPVGLVRAKYSACHHAKGPGDIPCTRIDDLLLPTLDVLVLDIEGGELIALQHATETLCRCRPLVVIEEYARWMKRYDRQPGDVARFLAGLGYRQVGAAAWDLALRWSRAMLEKWPVVLGEEATIQKVLKEHRSLCRLGDGELKLIRGQDYVREKANRALGDELAAILATPDPRCLVGIPTMDKRSPKYANWKQRQAAFLPYLSPAVAYVSAFVSRPDSAPWISTPQYAESVEDLWRGKKVALVCEPDSKLVKVVASACRKLWHIPCPTYGAYACIDGYESQIVRGRPDIVILSHGVSATCLAHRLACQNVQAIDLGSIGGFLARMLYLEKLPPVHTAVLHHPEAGSDHEAVRARLEDAGFQVFYCGEKS